MDANDVAEQPVLWRQMVERKEASADRAIRSSLFVGLDRDTAAPVFIPRNVLADGHYHICGRTGSGKTASALASIALQVLREDKYVPRDRRSPLVVLDLKGDLALFNTVRTAAREAGRPFRFLSTRPGDDYHFFDPFQMFRLGTVEPLQLASGFVRAFSLDYGLIYGGLYFTQMNVAILLDAVKEMMALQNQPTVGRLSRILTNMARKASNKDAKHIYTCLRFLSELPQTNIDLHQAVPVDQIDMLRVLEDCEVVYVSLPLDAEAPTLRQVASLILYTLSAAAIERRSLGKPDREAFVLVDEFYHIAGKSFGEFLSTVRERNIRMVLANQARSQLKAHDVNLPDVVQANVSVTQAFTLLPEELEYFAAESGQKVAYRLSYSLNPRGEMSQSASEYLTTNLDGPALQEINDTRLACLFHIRDGVYRPERRVRRVQTFFPQANADYQRHKDTPFPKRPTQVDERLTPPAGCDVAPVEDGWPEECVETKRPPVDPAASSAVNATLRMQKVWEQLQAEELG